MFYPFSCSPSLTVLILVSLTERLPRSPISAGRATLARGRISKRSVDVLTCPPGKDREFLWDDALAGFGVSAFPSGKRVYVAQFRRDGRSRRVAIGDHGRLTPDEARSRAKTVLGQVEQGADPADERRKARAVRTFREVADDFMRQHVEAKRKSRTYADYKALLDKRILPAIGNKRIVDLRRADVARLHTRRSATRYPANRSIAQISSIWNWAAKSDEVADADNPATAKRIERYPEKGRERFLTMESSRDWPTRCGRAKPSACPTRSTRPSRPRSMRPRRTIAAPSSTRSP